MASPRLRVTPLSAGGVGVVASVSPRDAADAPEGSDVVLQLARAVLAHGVVVLRSGGSGGGGVAAPDADGQEADHQRPTLPGGLLSPEEIGHVYRMVHAVAGMRCAPPVHAVATAEGGGGPATDLRGRCFPGHPETNVLGNAAEVRDWHGLTGFLRPSAWWERESIQFHHDGGFSAGSPPPPALVAMYSAVAPSRGGSTLRWPTGETLEYPPGATLFFSTRTALELADPAVAARARRMTCVYRGGFGRVVEGGYPVMSESGLTSTAPAPTEDAGAGTGGNGRFMSLENYAFDGAGPAVGASAGARGLYRGDGPVREFVHALVQDDGADGEGGVGRPYVLCHGLCLDHLEEEGRGSLSWGESVAFVEALLAPAARPPHLVAVGWGAGDLAIWDNRTTLHSVTPSHANRGDPGYAALGEPRLMTRTAMQPDWVPAAAPPRAPTASSSLSARR